MFKSSAMLKHHSRLDGSAGEVAPLCEQRFSASSAPLRRCAGLGDGVLSGDFSQSQAQGHRAQKNTEGTADDHCWTNVGRMDQFDMWKLDKR